MNNLKKYRNLAQMSQLVLAEKANCARSYVADVERGHQKLTLKMATKFAGVLRVDPHELLGSDAIKYEGTFYQSLQSLVDGNFDHMILSNNEGNEDDFSWNIYWINFAMIKNKMHLDDLKAIRAVVDLIAKKYEVAK